MTGNFPTKQIIKSRNNILTGSQTKIFSLFGIFSFQNWTLVLYQLQKQIDFIKIKYKIRLDKLHLNKVNKETSKTCLNQRIGK